MPLYWPLATIAAARAFAGLIARPHNWTKTTHGVSRRGAQTQKPGQNKTARTLETQDS